MKIAAHVVAGMLTLASASASACGEDDDDGGGDDGRPVTKPDVSLATFVAGVDNPYFPLPVGARWTYRADTDEGVERTEVEVLAETKLVNGVTAVVVKDTVYLDDEIVEDTRDWFAQDSAGNVWYLGEDTCEFEDGVCVRHAGAWEWGVDGAEPGIIMPATPSVDGERYYQEYYAGEAEDVGEVIAVGVSVTVAAGSYSDCVRTRDTSTLERDIEETKTYCRGVGNVLVEEDDVREELQAVTGLPAP
jgi:hypothetical protein